MDIKEKDWKMLHALDFHARDSFSQIAKRLKLSKQRVAYRIKKLEEEGIIQGYYADIDPSKIGLTIYLLYFRFRHISAQKEREMIAHLNKASRVSVNASTQGKWNHSIAIFARDIYDFREQYDNIMKDYERFVEKKMLTIITEFWYYPLNYLIAPASITSKCVSMKGPIEESKIDSKDEIILKALAENARIPLLELSKKTGLVPQAIGARIKRLERDGVILAYRLMINQEKLGKLHYRVFFFLGNDATRQKAFQLFLASQGEVVSITRTLGYCELEARIVVDGLHGFYSFIEKLKDKFSDIMKGYEPLAYFRFYKSLNYYPIKD